jgi:hypothetical protein
VPFTFLQSKGAHDETTTGVTTLALTTTSSVTAGSLIVILSKWDGVDGATESLSDGTDTLTRIVSQHHTNTDLHASAWYLPVSTAGTKTYTLTLDSARINLRMVMFEFSYTGGAMLLQQAVSNIGTALRDVTSGTMTVTGSDTLVIGGYLEYIQKVLSNPLINGLAATGSQADPSTYTKGWYRAFNAPFTGAATGSLTGGQGFSWLAVGLVFEVASGLSPATAGVLLTGASNRLGFGILLPKSPRRT